MASYSNEQLSYYLDDLNCQIDYLLRADKLDMLNEDEEFRLNSLIVKRAHFRKEQQNLAKSKNKVLSLLSKLNRLNCQPKKISDYFTSKDTD